MKEIKLTQGKVALVDDADFDWLNQWKWYAFFSRGNWYAARGHCENGIQRIRFMHNLILNCPKLKADHKDGNGLNNQRYNLRTATHLQNSWNSGVQRNNRSGFIGVCWCNRTGAWLAQIGYLGHRKHLGYFSSPVRAALARDAAAIKYFGEFARLNFPNNTEHKPSKLQT